jgi:hypothetical protein
MGGEFIFGFAVAIEMFVVTESDAAAIRAVFNQEGELSAAIDRVAPTVSGVIDNAKARTCAPDSSGDASRKVPFHIISDQWIVAGGANGLQSLSSSDTCGQRGQ